MGKGEEEEILLPGGGVLLVDGEDAEDGDDGGGAVSPAAPAAPGPARPPARRTEGSRSERAEAVQRALSAASAALRQQCSGGAADATARQLRRLLEVENDLYQRTGQLVFADRIEVTRQYEHLRQALGGVDAAMWLATTSGGGDGGKFQLL